MFVERKGVRFWLLGLVLPMTLVLGVVIVIPVDGPRYFGISLRSCALFGCAPVISLILAMVSGSVRSAPGRSDQVR